MLEVQRPRTRRQGLSEEEAELVGCGESSAIVLGAEHVLLSTDKRGGRLPKRLSDGLFLGVVESSSDIAAVKVTMPPHLISHQPHPNRFLADATSMRPMLCQFVDEFAAHLLVRRQHSRSALCTAPIVFLSISK